MIACKICVLTKGIKGSELGRDGKTFKTQAEFFAHLIKVHKIRIANMPASVMKKVKRFL
jgi:hypothetical protein